MIIRVTKAFLPISTFVALTACAPFVDVLDVKQITPEERATAMNVAIMPVGVPRPDKMTFVGPVEATSCKHVLTDPPASSANATEQLKIKAERMGANAVIDYACDRSGTDAYGTNCWNSVTCGGTAVKVSRPGNGQ